MCVCVVVFFDESTDDQRLPCSRLYTLFIRNILLVKTQYRRTQPKWPMVICAECVVLIDRCYWINVSRQIHWTADLWCCVRKDGLVGWRRMGKKFCRRKCNSNYKWLNDTINHFHWNKFWRYRIRATATQNVYTLFAFCLLLLLRRRRLLATNDEWDRKYEFRHKWLKQIVEREGDCVCVRQRKMKQ